MHVGEGRADALVGEEVAPLRTAPVAGEQDFLELGDDLALELVEQVVLVDEMQVEGATVDSGPSRAALMRARVPVLLVVLPLRMYILCPFSLNEQHVDYCS